MKELSKKKWERRLIRGDIVLLLILLLLMLWTCGSKRDEIVDGVAIGVIDMDEDETNTISVNVTLNQRV